MTEASRIMLPEYQKCIECNEELVELVKSIRNRCDIFELICHLPDAQRLLATLLEDNHFDSQEIIDNYCIVRGHEQ